MAAPTATPFMMLTGMDVMLQGLGLTHDEFLQRQRELAERLTAGSSAGADDLALYARDGGSAQPARTGSGRGRTLSRTASALDTSARAPSPAVPSTPVKAEPTDAPLPPRMADSMEMVMERKSRQVRAAKRARRERERNAPHPPSPSPAHGPVSMDAVVGGTARASRRPSVSGSSMGALGERPRSISSHGHYNASDASRQATPSMSQYTAYLTNQTYNPSMYSSSASQPTHSRSSSAQFKAPAPLRSQSSASLDLSAKQPHKANDSVKIEPDAMTPTSLRYYRENTFPDPRSDALSRQNSSNLIPVTPRRPRQVYPSGIPASPMSSPISTPSRGIVNMVSSPGPMGPAPEEDEYDNLPFKLPPGPYSTAKPDLSYSALIGRAVLSSPGHKLTLQEIYEWITIVHPYYRRDEQTWMNSVRHVLSTTACFRKVPRERGEGKTQWAIWDRDLKCFENGGFDKRFCADIPQKRVNGKKRGAPADELVLDVAGPGSGAVVSTSGGRRKRVKKDVAPAPLPPMTMVHPQPLIAYPMPVPAHVLPQMFPVMPVQGHPYHQSYYQACLPPGRMPADVIFPPLPPTAALNQRRMASSTAAPLSRPSTAATTVPASATVSPAVTPILKPAVPAQLTLATAPAAAPTRVKIERAPTPEEILEAAAPSHSQSTVAASPPSSSQLPELSMSSDPQGSSSPQMPNLDAEGYEDSGSPQIVDLEEFVSFSSPIALARDEGLAPGINLIQSVKKPLMTPDSPTLGTRHAKKSPVATSIFPSLHFSRFGTPLPLGRPVTPPPKPSGAKLQLSPKRTPLSHRGLHMSPSPSLAHYKSNLDPPAVYGSATADHTNSSASGEVENLRTPIRKRVPSGGALVAPSAFPPVTPKRLFPSAHDGGASTTGSGGFGAFGFFGSSPFRTPGILDPHDPGTLLDEELARLGAAQYFQDSPGGGLLGSRALLYESPNAPSPGRLSRYW